MLPTSLKYGVLLACGVLALAGLGAAAGDKKGEAPGLSGTWGQRGAELKIQFAKDALKIAPHGDSKIIAIVCDYTVTKGNVVKAKVTGFEGKDEAQQKVAGHLPIGTQFSFTWTAKGDTARLHNVKGDKADLLKSHLEGEFEKK